VTQNGGNFTASLRGKKDFKNPYILEQVINEFAIEQYASNYPPHLFNPSTVPHVANSSSSSGSSTSTTTSTSTNNSVEYCYYDTIAMKQASEEEERVRRQTQGELRTSIAFVNGPTLFTNNNNNFPHQQHQNHSSNTSASSGGGSGSGSSTTAAVAAAAAAAAAIAQGALRSDAPNKPPVGITSTVTAEGDLGEGKKRRSRWE
jgi:hypothetical protein